MSTRHRVAAAAAAVLALALVGCGAADAPVESPAASDPPVAPDPTPVEEALTAPRDLVTDLDAPWSIAFLGDTVIISERDTGHILEVVGDTTRVIGTVEDLFTRAEAGLLGLAVDDRARLYAYSTGNDGNRIQRFTVTGEPGALALGAPETILDGIPHAPTHDGGRIAFGPDGMLYATTGDAGDPGRAQNRDDLAGKILRMTPDGDVPSDNPFAGSLVYSYGHRNPQGIAWAADGTLFAAEFGQNTWDELNIITPGGNYGWPAAEGIAGIDRFIDPVQQWAPAEASPSGIAIAGDTIYLANLRGERLRAVPVADPTTSEELHVGEFGRLRDVVAISDPSTRSASQASLRTSAEIWLLTNNTDGRGSPASDDDRVIRVPVG